MALATSFPNSAFSYGFGKDVVTGNRFYVDSGAVNASDGNTGLSPARSFSTVDAAVGACTANNGDVVYVMPGHSETFSAAAAWALDVAGVRFQGLGTGTDRPKIIMDTATTVDINVSAANVSIDNFQFEAAFADIAKIFHLTAKQFHVTNCEFREQVATENWILVIDCDGTTNGECDGLHFNNNVVIGADTKNENVLKSAADLTGLEFNDNYIELGILNDDAIIECTTGKDVKSVQILRNRFLRLNTDGELLLNANGTTGNTGICAYNLFGCLDIAAIVLIEAGTHIFQFENYVTSELDLSGFLDPPAATDS